MTETTTAGAAADRRAAIRGYLEGRGYARHDATHAEAWELSGPGGQPSLRVIFWPRTTRVYAGIDWRDEFDVNRPPGPIVAYLEAAERELGLVPGQPRAELAEGDLKAERDEAQSEAAMIRDHANRFLRAVYGPDVIYRAPETFSNLLERWIWAVGAGVPEIAHASIADIERTAAEGPARG